MSVATTPTAAEAPALDERDLEPRTPMKRLGSTRKLAAFSSVVPIEAGTKCSVSKSRAGDATWETEPWSAGARCRGYL
ncbi:unnamed protein product, partial [Iphiclides podalirius]